MRQLLIAAIEPAADPPQMSVEVMINGRRSAADRDSGARAGDEASPVTTVERWTLAHCGPPERRWQIAAVAPATAA